MNSFTSPGDSEDIVDENSTILMPDEDRKFLIFETCLLELMNFCSKCGSPIIERSTFVRGTMIGIKYTCQSNCSEIWRSQPLIRGMPSGNLLTAGAILFSGGQYERMSDFARILYLNFITSTTFYDIQQTYLFPIISCEYKLQQTALLGALEGDKVFLCEDGQCDSPGHNAKYLTYTLIDDDSGYIVSSDVVCVKEEDITNSNAMELEGLKRCLSIVE